MTRRDAIREILTSPKTIPIPGFRTVKQVEENSGAMQFGPLHADQMAEIDRLLER